MSIIESTVISGAAHVGLAILTLSMTLVLFRIVRGPKNADRIIALDLLSVLVVALVVLYALFTNEAVFLDVALAYALVAFLGTVAFARYLERSAQTTSVSATMPRKGEKHD